MLFLHVCKYAFDRFLTLRVNPFVLFRVTEVVRLLKVIGPDVSADPLREVFASVH